MDYNVKLDIFEGPLDLLVHLIRKNEMDIYDIPIAVITAQYLEYLDLMKDLNINIAGNFLVMAATLIHIKSKMLLPRPPDDEEEEDPRMELARPLMEYLQLKEAAEQLGQRPVLYRDVFTRDFLAKEMEGKEEGMIRVGLFELIAAVRKMLLEKKEEAFAHLPSPLIPIENKMEEILDQLKQMGRLLLEELLPAHFGRAEIIVVFLALLELAKLHKIIMYQEIHEGNLLVYDFLPPATVS
ncbi:MAG: segregation/condensation protein A [Deltaproteobacteria bacterium]|nr:segregation/condensation protein A [Deltaproteobacteria bacterium]